MLLRIIKHILSVIPFIGIGIALLMIIPKNWLTPRKAVIIGFLGLMAYNLFAPTKCFPHMLCFLNQREGLSNPPASQPPVAVIAAAAAKGAAQGVAQAKSSSASNTSTSSPTSETSGSGKKPQPTTSPTSAGTPASMSNQVAATNSKITKMRSDVEDAINRLIKLTQEQKPANSLSPPKPNIPMQNLMHWSNNTPIFEKTAIQAQGALAKEEKKDDDSGSSSKISSEEAKMAKYS
tara:strand:+ start:134 stop:838 length:705 start_codon:yes stop_codon:yes gene_type:complete